MRDPLKDFGRLEHMLDMALLLDSEKAWKLLHKCRSVMGCNSK